LSTGAKGAAYNYPIDMGSDFTFNMEPVDSLFNANEDFTLFDDNSKPMTAAPLQFMTPFNFTSTSPLPPSAVLDTDISVDNNTLQDVDSLFSDVQFNSGAAYACDE